MLKHLEDTSPGVHDMLLSACDVERYRRLGCEGYHDNCADNLRTALTEMDVIVVFSACPMDIVLTNGPDRMP